MNENRSVARQSIWARKISQSHIEQHIGDKFVVDLRTESPLARPIYFTYADSDVQALYLNRARRERAAYFEAMRDAFQLLLAFKPASSPILISPSSIVQSSLTRALILPYFEANSTDAGHILILRREPTWQEYFDKRQRNTHHIRQTSAYHGYFDPITIEQISGLPASRKKFYSGAGATRRFAFLVKKAVPWERLRLRSLNDVANELLATRAFVFETAMDSLGKLDVNIAQTDIRSALVDAYLSAVAMDCAVPTAIRLPWDPCPAAPGYPCYSVTSMLEVALQSGLAERILRAPPEALLQLASSSELEGLRIRISQRHGEWWIPRDK